MIDEICRNTVYKNAIESEKDRIRNIVIKHWKNKNKLN